MVHFNYLDFRLFFLTQKLDSSHSFWLNWCENRHFEISCFLGLVMVTRARLRVHLTRSSFYLYILKEVQKTYKRISIKML